MNELWEEYVLKMLKKYSREHPQEGWSIHGQESKHFYGSSRRIRPDIVLRKGEECFVIDTKWKRPTNKSASIEDLRQMYTYGRFWDADRLLLLYPGTYYDSGYENYPNTFDENSNHHCKVGMVSVLSDISLDLTIGEKVISMLNTKYELVGLEP
jgi:5-methylcytosine-specific restriction enzyme subunit McrC